MAQVLFFSSLILTFIFKVKYLHFNRFANISQTVIDKANIIIAIRYEVWHFPSNGAAANVVYHDLDLNFQDHEFLKCEYLENGES